MTTEFAKFESILSAVAGSEFTQTLFAIFSQLEWAEDEIRRAQHRHPDVADVLHHSFPLLTATEERMATEFVYRAHAQELLDRVATGVSTKPGTSVEVVLSLMRASLVTPLNTTAFGLYVRMWRQAGLPEVNGLGDDVSRHYEAVNASGIDEFEATARRKLAQSSRVLTLVACEGRHFGEPVDCRLASARAA
ncbi:hypothetical protein NN3_01370 [Nocardia neocaledoniensis NBRC 108232]|uniref:Uncharacterized protein n=1 Tax=Nocardia neocaledoniensis TaxID=236511 RepID=A0A317NGT2_9NOCA|nr:hypothetical protein [Nocardia neocaledoniensis]PWV74375.1 hypothetical protein DFR69_106186 [Nocardia neocaledoniensis]GEM29130.1 hypothetical protein NN3_01370 [Nocardia neocaledoniensis NBRC 108232]